MGALKQTAPTTADARLPPRVRFARVRRYTPYAAAIAAVAAAVAVGFLLRRMPLANLSLVFLTGAMVVAARWGLGPSLFASVLSFVAFNFFFTPPYFTLRVASEGDVATLLFFLAMAALTGSLAARMRREMVSKEAALARVSELHAFSRRMAAAASTQDVLDVLCERLEGILHVRVAALAVEARGESPVWSSNASRLPPVLLQTARAALQDDTVQRAGSWRLSQMSTPHGVAGLVAIEEESPIRGDDDVVRALCDQAAVAIERTQLVADLAKARVQAETEQLRSALLASVSHDLRTPLASIIGSTSSLLDYGEAFSARDRRELLQTVLEESQRLDRYVQNLLDMTRLAGGAVALRRDWVDLNDLVASALQRLRPALSEHPVEVQIDADAALLFVHGVLLEQVLVNLLENAVEHSPFGSRILVEGHLRGDRVVIDVIDEGSGVADGERERIFDMFYSVSDAGRPRGGTGLGLSICRGLVGAHGGSIQALPGPGGVGTRMHITLPRTTPPSDEASAA